MDLRIVSKSNGPRTDFRKALDPRSITNVASSARQGGGGVMIGTRGRMPRIRLLVAVAAVVGLLVGRQAAAIGDVVTSDPDTTQDIYGLAPDDVTIDPAVAPLLADASALSLEDPDPYCMNGYSYQPYMTYQYKTYSIAFG